jgi:hypothetical protein
MVRTIVKIVFALLVAHALYHFLPVYISYHLFRDDVKQAALFGAGATQQELVEQVMLHAQAREVPLERANVWVRKEKNQTFIDTAYEQPVRVLPWYTYTWHVEVSADAVQMTAPRRGGGQ